MAAWAAVVLVWLTLVALLVPALLLSTVESVLTALVAGLTAALACLFLFYSGYHYVFLFTACQSRRRRKKKRIRPSAAADPPSPAPSVARLLTVCDDFIPAAAAEFLQLNYNPYHMYVCDDSQTQRVRGLVDAFARDHPEQVTLLRRLNRSGFKAGNLNHALHSGVVREDLLFFADVDEVVERNHLATLVTELFDGKPAFVQASHKAWLLTRTPFAAPLAPTVEAYWTVYEQVRNRYGFPLFLGHGALIGRELVEKLGGFDEATTSEDIALTYCLAFDLPETERGRVSEEVFALEALPSTLDKYRSRSYRWMVQNCVYAWGAGRQVLRNRRRLGMKEKIDLVVKQLHLPACLVSECYLFVAGLFLVLLNAEQQTSGVPAKSVLLFLFVLGAAVAPAMPVLIIAPGRPTARIASCLASLRLFNSLATSTLDALGSLILSQGSRQFFPTGAAALPSRRRPSRELRKALLAVLAVVSASGLLFAMVLAAVTAEMRPGRARSAAGALSVVFVIAGVVQSILYPPYAAVLLPLGAFRY